MPSRATSVPSYDLPCILAHAPFLGAAQEAIQLLFDGTRTKYAARKVLMLLDIDDDPADYWVVVLVWVCDCARKMLIPWLLLGLAGNCLAKIYEDVSDLPGLDYDFVIVGAGAAGNVVANRLTENPNFSVLVLEAGVSNEGVIDAIVPFFWANLSAEPNIYEWNYTTTPQVGLNNRSVPYSRAHILGGCTSHNAMVYTRGSAEDYNRWADVTKDPGWSWDSLLPYFFKNEKWTPPADKHDTHGEFNPAVHSTYGINSVSLSGSRWPIFENQVIQTTREFPEEFPFNLDYNSGEPLGVGKLDPIYYRWRQAKLIGDIIPRTKIHTATEFTCSAARTSLEACGSTDHRGRRDLRRGGIFARYMYSVKERTQFTFLQADPFFTAKASKEMILSAGSVGTPAILLNSGVGDKSALTALGITSVLDLPSVGQNATDQPAIFAEWSVNSTQTLDPIEQNTNLLNEAYAQWNASRTGPFTNIGTTHIAWTRLDANSPIFESVTDPAAGPKTPHIEILVGTGSESGDGPTGNFINFLMVMLTPTSRGSITLQSNNPFDPPLIDPGILITDFDLFAIRESIKKAYRFVEAPVWKDYIIAPTVNFLNMSTDALDEFIRNTSSPAAHMVSTAAMSAKDASYGVVNPDLLVKGASGLRIIDASIIPFIPSAHTQAPTYVVAERGADLIKARWK
ncbi:GMC oxidoreductase [Mycena sanguinolenta]|uniref:GMC oxidoreductase n=1 Tax=Mycena sanguinolenta TaxID=230812 RepID=A0A8H6ZBC4_9AGAR|nr:GMC oxidoreductase [Mycena sanguinolenta]